MEVEESSLQESPRPNKKRIANDRSTSSLPPTQDTKSSKTSSPPKSTSKRGKDCVPFYTELTKEWSQKLWSVREKDLQDSPLIYWNESSKEKGVNSWYTVKGKTTKNRNNLPKNLWQSLQSVSQVIMENEQRKEEQNAKDKEEKRLRKKNRSKAKKTYELPRVTKYQVYPSRDQKVRLIKMFGMTRDAYNTAVEVHRLIELGDEEMLAKIHEKANEQRYKKGKALTKIDKKNWKCCSYYQRMELC